MNPTTLNVKVARCWHCYATLHPEQLVQDGFREFCNKECLEAWYTLIGVDHVD